MSQRVSGPDVPAVTISESGARGASLTDEKRLFKVHAFFCLALEIFLNIAETDLDSLDMADEPAIAWAARACGIAMVAVKHLSAPRTAGLTATLKRWQAFCVQQGLSPTSLSPSKAAGFLRSVSHSGPTAASAVYQARRWLRVNMAASFPVEHFTVKPFCFNCLGRKSEQAPALQP